MWDCTCPSSLAAANVQMWAKPDDNNNKGEPHGTRQNQSGQLISCNSTRFSCSLLIKLPFTCNNVKEQLGQRWWLMMLFKRLTVRKRKAWIHNTMEAITWQTDIVKFSEMNLKRIKERRKTMKLLQMHSADKRQQLKWKCTTTQELEMVSSSGFIKKALHTAPHGKHNCVL